LTEFGEYAADLITDEQRAAMFAAQANAEELVRLLEPQEFEGVGAVWGEVDPEVPRALAGNLADGSPLRTRLVQLAREGARAVADTMVAHVARGAAPIELARELRGALGVNLSKAQTIARTETLRAYREVTRRSYQTNAHIVQAWIWHAALTSRTCAACWAMHGSTHELSDTLDGHPNCRCAMVPLTKSYEELGVIGVEENRRPVPMGPAEFARASSQTQRAILGDRAYAAYQAGEVQLADFVGQKHSDEWGSMRYRRSLREAREAAARGSAGLDINQPGTPSPFQQNPE
jgi:SPP1 gp7 family putative phage head morphogenesis protein